MKKTFFILPLALILCFVVGCQDKEAMGELEEFRAQAAVEEQNKEIVKGLLEELNKGNADIWKELCAPEFVYYSPSESPEPMSVNETIECFQMAFKGFPDINWKTQDLVAKEDKVIARITQAGTHEGEFRGIPATGNKTEFGVIPIFQFKDGKCIEVREEADMLGFMQQIGFELVPKEEK
jgi:steroid delta-isomerase-like uncharacterized protein